MTPANVNASPRRRLVRKAGRSSRAIAALHASVNGSWLMKIVRRGYLDRKSRGRSPRIAQIASPTTPAAKNTTREFATARTAGMGEGRSVIHASYRGVRGHSLDMSVAPERVSTLGALF